MYRLVPLQILDTRVTPLAQQAHSEHDILAQQINQLQMERIKIQQDTRHLEFLAEYATFARERIDLLSTTARHLIQQYMRPETIPNYHVDTCAAQKSIPLTHKIALVLPVTSKGMTDYKNSVIFKTFVSSLVETASQGYHYRLYLGYNAGDKLYDNAALFKQLFLETLQELQFDCTKHMFSIDYYPVRLPKDITGSTGLSILFATPTLAAYHDGADYFYLANDDMKMVTRDWTNSFVQVLEASPVLKNFGLTGPEDLSGAQPFLEFPFFHRVHVDIFASFGAHTWIFRNWFEDNWINDVYTPWSGMYYLRHVKVTNYVGLNQIGERYQVEIRSVPKFFIEEVEEGRRAIVNYLQRQNLPKEKQHYLHVKLGYCQVPGASLQVQMYNYKVSLNPCNK